MHLVDMGHSSAKHDRPLILVFLAVYGAGMSCLTCMTQDELTSMLSLQGTSGPVSEGQRRGFKRKL